MALRVAPITPLRSASARNFSGRRTSVTVSASASRAPAGVAMLSAAALLIAAPNVKAADLALGEQIFNGNCAACHMGGRNNVIPDHTLDKAAMEQFLDGGFNLDAIIYQVRTVGVANVDSGLRGQEIDLPIASKPTSAQNVQKAAVAAHIPRGGMLAHRCDIARARHGLHFAINAAPPMSMAMCGLQSSMGPMVPSLRA
ncbi:hypothetical protein Agub_g1532 [Astrephomene gubernaculifera]|uniref:Cytochrome c domain-containing protein n=1 Tax=Astrephomene gubernaculifera TaxID=47775 RepID=A0AAD3HHT4_9CHLO|nr:hypothetical protein Agub_g1532 [Astrephomene gubernaculifera]